LLFGTIAGLVLLIEFEHCISLFEHSQVLMFLSTILICFDWLISRFCTYCLVIGIWIQHCNSCLFAL